MGIVKLKKIDITNKDSLFCIILALFPLLGVYRSPIPSIDIGTVGILLFGITSFGIRVYKNDVNPIIVYILIFSPLMFLLSNDANNVLYYLRYAKIILSLGLVFCFGLYKRFYNEDKVMRIVKVTIYVCSIYIFIQRILSIFGLYIQNPLVMYATFDGYLQSSSIDGKNLFRPSGFFLEPSHFSFYGVIFLIYSLFKKANFKDALLVTISIICTGSGMGLISVGACWIAYFLLDNSKNRIGKKIVLMIALIISFIYLSRTTFFHQVVNRFTTDNVGGGGNAIDARIGLGYQIFQEKGVIYKIFGCGYGYVPANIYLNGLTYILNTLGFIGLVLFTSLMIKTFLKGDSWKKIGVIFYVFLGVFSQIFNPSSLIFSLCLLLTNDSQGDSDQNKNK